MYIRMPEPHVEDELRLESTCGWRFSARHRDNGYSLWLLPPASNKLNAIDSFKLILSPTALRLKQLNLMTFTVP